MSRADFVVFQGPVKNNDLRLCVKQKTVDNSKKQISEHQPKRFPSEVSVLCHYTGHMPLKWVLPVSMVCSSSCYYRVYFSFTDDGFHHRNRFVHGDMAR